ncbi:unnamed protein product [Fraxinus pennsylvanica]|uniref:Disease resistance RPP13-like protein 1 n=1 Tax=Fraxinus pennsylvanica TaxID=56036 RepID=A0AAD2DZS6_9LAMI|nr:unnamed protein product [Fraxinus pennsylvanica]
MPLGELFLSAFIQILFQQLASGLLVTFTQRERIDTHRKKWSQNLDFIQAVLDDAEDKQLTDQHVKVWLEGLRDLFYDLEDILDEITTLALIQRHKGVLPRTSLFRKLIPTCTGLLPGSIASNYRMMSKIKEISNRFDEIVKQRNGLKLENNLGGHSNRLVTRLPSTSLNEPHIYGRDKDKEAMRKLLIVTDDSGESKDLNMLQVSLQQELSKSKFLIVLDDLWNEDYEKWNTLCLPFQYGQPGSRIIVTTRLGHVASKVGSVPAYHMNLLTDGDCLSLLAHHAKRSIDADPDIREIGTCYRLDEKVNTNEEYRVPEKTRHASFLRHEFEVFTKFRAFKQVQGLRTFIPMPVQNSHVWPPFYLSNKILLELLPELHRLRVLSLSGYSITELPSIICKLFHLRCHRQ